MSFTREAYRRLRHPGVRIHCFLGCVVCFFCSLCNIFFG